MLSEKIRGGDSFFCALLIILSGKAISMKTLGLFCLIIGIPILFGSCDASDKTNPADLAPSLKSPVSSKSKTKLSPARKNAGKAASTSVLTEILGRAKKCVQQNGYSTEYCFLIDMGIKSGKNRFFVYNLERNTVLLSGLVAHGSCNTQFLSHARFSNALDCGCSSSGKYRVGSFYHGEYGKSYRLYGLDRSNSNAFKRAIVLHGHECIPDEEIYPRVLCNSFGCPMVSESFFEKLSTIIERSERPILLWIYE
jgi:hypothetical protein